jgi:hypothetical protein
MNYRVYILIAMIVFSPLARPQAVPAGSSAQQAPLPFSGGQQTNLQYAGERFPANAFVLDAGYQASYDDNVLVSSGPGRQGDQVHDFITDLSLFHRSPRLNAVIDYSQSDELYGSLTAYNHIDQRLVTDLGFQLSPHWSSSFHDVFFDQTSPFYQGLNDAATGELGSPSAVNTSIYIPPVDQKGNLVRGDLLWQATVRTSLSAFGGTDYRSFGARQLEGHSLMNTTGESTGAQYAWRTTEHSTLGLLYTFQRLTLSGTLPVDSPSRLDNQSALSSLGWQPRPTIEIALFAGPAFIKQNASNTSADALHTQDSSPVVGEWGATVSQKVGRASWFLSADRIVNDGGGIMGFVVNSTFDVGLRWQLPIRARWDATWNLQAAQNSSLTKDNGAYDSNSQSGSFGLEHPLGNKLIARLGYNFARQSSSGTVPFDSDFHRNRISLGISVHWNAISLTH